MLKALELVGFKSFADKTRFEFTSGITVVVGPNGSGKSNVVDAIKWVLGEQSVKSLRGKEMADVIFNGSSGRGALNSCETTLTFDNSSRLLPIDTDEVHVTRRVYRSGEGEYLINRQPCRRRDIRDMFSGTGVATEAYSVIEQGKVDVMLQASPRDRRTIFEEAAGISRFKAKKVEALRRMERVDQNLLRLSDIVQEVDARLRSVRAQATKARRYKEHTDRLQELRTQVGLVDWRAQTEKLTELKSGIQRVEDELNALLAKAESDEAESLRLETQVTDVNESIRAAEARVAENREQIAGHESSIEHGRQRVGDLEQEIARLRRQLSGMNVRVGDLQQQLRETTAAVELAESQHAELSGRLEADERALLEIAIQSDATQAEDQRLRALYMDQMRQAALLGNEASALESEQAGIAASQEALQTRIAAVAASRAELAAKLETLRVELQAHLEEFDRCGEALAAANAQLAGSRSAHSRAVDDLNTLKNQHAGATERAGVLEELERRLEGLGSGVKEMLIRARAARGGPFSQIRGLVADLLTTPVESAPLVEVALGEKAGYLVIAPGERFIEYIQREAASLHGRVGFVPRELAGDDEPAANVDLSDQPGVIGRVLDHVETAAEFQPLARRLLADTWIVETLPHAFSLARRQVKGARYVTLAGELLEADGTLIVGPRHASVGLISRRSELRVLKERIAELSSQIEHGGAEVAALERQIAADQQRVDQAADAHHRADSALAEHRLEVNSAQQRHGQYDEQHQVLSAELSALVARGEQTSQKLASVRVRLHADEETLEHTQCESHEVRERSRSLESQHAEQGQAVTTLKVQLAKSEQRLDHLRARKHQFEQDSRERWRSIEDVRQQLSQAQARLRQTESEILRSASTVADLFLRKESFSRDTVALVNQREELRRRRAELAGLCQQHRTAARSLEERLQQQRLASSEIQLERNALASRLRDDYGIELSQLEHEPTAEELHQREEVDQEIAELRRKINNIGTVNLQALEELEELETRFSSLSGQYEDLVSAKSALDEIIRKINTDSRRLFTETLESVRANFQTLFRKLFGGGQADIVLEENVDILDSGIEIVARPPGTKPAYIAQLSGGQRALTCVALLMAIFQYRPSPFCVLDEVDAPLDEANIERFIGVLREFLAWTQFIVVTHSKKTMTAAHTLYGVTMQESGISKRVSVRFEDVSEGGHISAPEDGDADDDETQAA